MQVYRKQIKQRNALRVVSLLLAAAFVTGCMQTRMQARLKDSDRSFAAGSILSLPDGRPIDFDTLVAELAETPVVFVGESHTSRSHHAIQLKILTALADLRPEISVGMEMFDVDYQPLLDRWSAGELSLEQLVEATHWYANWRYDITLYEELLTFVKDRKLRLVALNIPPHIPPKISTGGLDSLLPSEKSYLPRRLDTSDSRHREWVERIFRQHNLRGRKKFDYFYAAQCVWEDKMAESIVASLGSGQMVVLAGNGHIIRKFGIPDRVSGRNGLETRTVYLVTAGSTFTLADGDYVWVTPR